MSPLSSIFAVGRHDGRKIFFYYLFWLSIAVFLPKSIWAAFQASPIKQFRSNLQKAPVNAVAFSPTEPLLATSDQNGRLVLWEVASSKVKAALTGAGGAITALAFSHDGKTLAGTCEDCSIYLWNIETGKLSGKLLQPQSAPAQPDGSDAKSSDAGKNTDKKVEKPEAEKTSQSAGKDDEKTDIQATDQNDPMSSLAFLPDGRLVTGGYDGLVRLWNVQQKKSRSLSGHNGAVTGIAVSPDGKTIASSSWDDTVRLWDVGSGKARFVLRGQGDWVNCLTFSPDGKNLASGDISGGIVIWDALKGEQVTRLTEHKQSVICLNFSPDGKTLASGSWDHRIILWDWKNGTPQQIMAPDADWVESLSYSADGNLLASGHFNGTIKIWGVAAKSASTP